MLKLSEEVKDLDHYETLMDVRSACGTAVEILNDLLCFDKLESGILELHKHQVPAISFVTDCVNMFAAQAREGGVKINCAVGSSEDMGGSSRCLVDPTSISATGSSSTETNLLESDLVFMDKFKMDQVLRNLISNALKFTPRGGSVTVSAHFMPTDDVESAAVRDSDEGHDPEGEHPQWRAISRDEVAAPPDNSSSGWGLSSFVTAFSNFIVHWVSRPGEHWRVRTFSDAAASNDIDDTESPLHLPSFRADSGLNCRYRDGAAVLSSGGDKRDEYKACAADDVDSGHANTMWDAMAASERGTQSYSNAGRMTYGRLKLIVTDTGVGISEVNQLRLFKQIVQFNPEVLQAGGGSGLGLYITSSIVHMHAGTIRAQSAGPGEGSTFTVEIDMQRWIPYAQSLSVADVPHQLSRPPSAPGVKPRRSIIMSSSIPREREMEGEMEKESEKEGEREKEEKRDTKGDMEMERNLAAEPATTNVEMRVNPASVASSKKLSEILAVYVDLEGEQYGTSKGERDKNGDSDCDCFAQAPMLVMSSVQETSKEDATLSALPTKTLHRKEKHEHHANILPSVINIDIAYDILIVDDSSLNRKMLSRLLRTAGYTCEEADDGLSAVEKVKTRMSRGSHMTQSYDVILMDFVMPNMDGPTATVAIRGMGYTKPILGLTGNALDSDVNYFIDCGVNAVLTKPFDFSLFKALMRIHTNEGDLTIS